LLGKFFSVYIVILWGVPGWEVWWVWWVWFTVCFRSAPLSTTSTGHISNSTCRLWLLFNPHGTEQNLMIHPHHHIN
jgi:hypothetical protein